MILMSGLNNFLRYFPIPYILCASELIPPFSDPNLPFCLHPVNVTPCLPPQIMSDDQKAHKEEDESADEAQLKIVEDEPSQSGAGQEHQEESGTKSELASPNLNNNNDLASPSTSSQKAGGSGMCKWSLTEGWSRRMKDFGS